MKRLIHSKEGFTLVEVLVSTVLITLIFASFAALFVQGTKTNMASENIVDATYLAQSEMEQIFALSKSNNTGTSKEKMQKQYGMGSVTADNKWIQFEKAVPNSTEQYRIRLENTPNKITRVIVEIMDKNYTTTRAKMENHLLWEGE